jgi:hypothetical protein
VIAEGHPGRTTVHDDPVEGAHRNGLTVLPALLESHKPVDAVLMMLGTNDLKERFSVNACDIALSLERLVRVIRARAAGPGGMAPGVLLVAPPPILEVGCLAEMFAGGAAKSASWLPRSRRGGRRNGVPWLDAGAGVKVSPIDGIHYAPRRTRCWQRPSPPRSGRISPPDCRKAARSHSILFAKDGAGS